MNNGNGETRKTVRELTKDLTTAPITRDYIY